MRRSPRCSSSAVSVPVPRASRLRKRPVKAARSLPASARRRWMPASSADSAASSRRVRDEELLREAEPKPVLGENARETDACGRVLGYARIRAFSACASRVCERERERVQPVPKVHSARGVVPSRRVHSVTAQPQRREGLNRVPKVSRAVRAPARYSRRRARRPNNRR